MTEEEIKKAIKASINEVIKSKGKTEERVSRWVPLLLVALSGIIWTIRLEGKVDGHIGQQAHRSGVVEDIAIIKTKLDNISKDIADLEKKIDR